MLNIRLIQADDSDYLEIMHKCLFNHLSYIAPTCMHYRSHLDLASLLLQLEYFHELCDLDPPSQDLAVQHVEAVGFLAGSSRLCT